MYKKTVSVVISFHLFFMMILLFNPLQPPVRRTTHIKVHTVKPKAKMNVPVKKMSSHSAQTITAPQRKNVATSQELQPSKTPPKQNKPQTSIAPKKPAISNKPVVVEKEKSVKKVVQKKNDSQQEIWNEIDQALAKIEKKSYPCLQQTAKLPSPSIFLDETRFGQEKWGLEGEDETLSHVMGYLHDTLHLPEVGEVKMEITVRKDGTVAKVVVLRAESQKNKIYLQEHLPHMQFPLQFNQEKTWIMTFCNEV